jgi:hypothetical protein
MPDVDVTRAGPAFNVRVSEGSSATEHQVSVDDADLDRLGAGYASPEDFIRACFEFLLAREPKEQILARFDLSVIGRYFPEFEREIRKA